MAILRPIICHDIMASFADTLQKSIYLLQKKMKTHARHLSANLDKARLNSNGGSSLLTQNRHRSGIFIMTTKMPKTYFK